jgi:acyl-CoA thioester hydrolase
VSVTFSHNRKKVCAPHGSLKIFIAFRALSKGQSQGMKYQEIHILPVTIDFDLLDAGGVVHHPNYLVLCERARAKALEDIGYPHSEMLKNGSSFALAETHSKYLKPALLEQKLFVLTKCIDFSRATVTLEQELVSLHPNHKSSSGYLKAFPKDLIDQVYFWIKIRLVSVKLNPLKAQAIPELLIQKLKLKKND